MKNVLLLCSFQTGVLCPVRLRDVHRRWTGASVLEHSRKAALIRIHAPPITRPVLRQPIVSTCSRAPMCESEAKRKPPSAARDRPFPYPISTARTRPLKRSFSFY
ncbi:unnamed protein product [Heligmosomoides polygyrus]|uniref:Secreted protein n=1 Tax=Heligmosomoides polygyrus TaxID=6339 RepID=A0A183FL24_HELPZ|nr:unnamed protein product [Heligmosomoides polygyrus]